MEDLNDLFEAVFVLNLPTSVDRRALMDNELKGAQLTYLPGIVGASLSEDGAISPSLYDRQKALATKWNKTDLTPNEIGCALSHRAAWARLVSDGLQSALILEDDVEVIPATLRNLPGTVDELPDDWDLLYLGYHQNERMDPVNWTKLRLLFPLMNMAGLRSHDLRLLRRYWPRSYGSAIRESGLHYGAYAYAISRSGAERLLKEIPPVYEAVDMTLGWMSVRGDLRSFVASEKVFRPVEGVRSTIGKRN